MLLSQLLSSFSEWCSGKFHRSQQNRKTYQLAHGRRTGNGKAAASICAKDDASSCSQASTVPSPATIGGLRSQIDTVKKRYLKLIGISIQEYVSGVYSDYCKHPSTTPIANALAPIESLYKVAVCIEHDILQMDGVGPAWKHAEDVCEQIRSARCMVDDLFCYALLGFDDAIDAHDKGLMAFQSAS